MLYILEKTRDIQFHDMLNFRYNGYYEVLGLPMGSSAKIADIKHAYLRIAMKHHPDKAGADNENSKEIFEEASEAYR